MILNKKILLYLLNAALLISFLSTFIFLLLTVSEISAPVEPKQVGNNFRKLSFAIPDIAVRQTKTHLGNNEYAIKTQLYLKNIQPLNATMKDLGTDYPISFRDKGGEGSKTTYMAEFDTLKIETTSKVVRKIQTMLGLMMASILLIVLFVMWKAYQIIRSVKTDPFSRDNVRRLFTIGLIIQLIPTAYRLFYFWLEWYLRHNLNIRSFEISHSFGPFSMFVFILGLLIMSLTYALNSGIKLKEEQALTI